MRISFIACLSALAWTSPATAEELAQPYAGLEARDIASLSEDDVDALSEGQGWGLALSAELNGYPGPTHVLELADPLELTEVQRLRIIDIMEEMRAEAIDAGAELIAAERALDQAFRTQDVTPRSLEDLVDAAATARGNLRFIHLSRHLETVEILSAHQIETYNTLRGYTADPCSSVPEGHDPAMWRRHNGCDG